MQTLRFFMVFTVTTVLYRSTSDHINVVGAPLKRSESFDRQGVDVSGRPSMDYVLHGGSLRAPSMSNRYYEPYNRGESTFLLWCYKQLSKINNFNNEIV